MSQSTTEIRIVPLPEGQDVLTEILRDEIIIASVIVMYGSETFSPRTRMRSGLPLNADAATSRAFFVFSRA